MIWQSLLLCAAVLYLCAARRLHFGALIVLCVVEKLWIGGELATDFKELAARRTRVHRGRGRSEIFIVAKLRRRSAALTRFGFWGSRSLSLFAAYFIFAVPMFGGTWWDASFVFGSIAEAGLVGLCISQLLLAGSQTVTNYGMKLRLSPIVYAFALATTAAAPRLRSPLRILSRRALLHRLREAFGVGLRRSAAACAVRRLADGPLGYPVWGLRFFPRCSRA